MATILRIPGNQLSAAQYAQIDVAEVREFGLHLPPRSEIADRLYFLLVDDESEGMLACGYLKPITPVRFCGQTFSFLNIGGVIAHPRGKGYGKQVMLAIREHLLAHDQTGLGFCWPNNQGFYEKCGFSVEPNATARFIYRSGGGGDQAAVDQTAGGQYILYLESSERFMEKVLAQPVEEVLVPDAGIW